MNGVVVLQTIQATIDICLHLIQVRNYSQSKLGPIQIQIMIVDNENEVAIPYQVIQKRQKEVESKIDLQTFSTNFIYLNSMQTVILDQIIIFKLHYPIELVEKGSLKCFCRLNTINELAFNNQDYIKFVKEVQISFSSILYLESYLPVLFNHYGVGLEANIFSHLLTCKINSCLSVDRYLIYQSIDHLVICHNKMIHKLNFLLNNQINSQKQIQKISQLFILPSYTNMKQYPEYILAQQFIQKRSNDQNQLLNHLILLKQLIYKFLPEITKNLLVLWKRFIKQMTYEFSKKYKTIFEQALGIQLKKTIQYKRYEKNIDNLQKMQYTIWLQQQKNKFELFSPQSYIFLNNLKQNYENNPILNYQKSLIVNNLKLSYPTLKIINESWINHKFQQFKFNHQPHIVVLVHGLGATSTAFSQFQLYLKYIYGHIFILNSSINQNATNQSIDQMSVKLAVQVFRFIGKNDFRNHFKLSFIAHSLGGLVVRAALPKLQPYRFNMKLFVTLSTPHLGYFFHNSNLNKAGMWAISKFTDHKIINCLLMNDTQSNHVSPQTYLRQSFIYNLSLSIGIDWFQDIMLYGSSEDYFVGPLSALIVKNNLIQQKSNLEAQIWEEMRSNLQQYFTNVNISRFLVNFNQQTQFNVKDHLLGRKSHILYLSSKDFIQYILLVHKNLFI